MLWASRRCGGRPVKWVSTRSEALLGDSHGRDQVVTGELALDEHGKDLGLRVDSLHAVGSHVFDASMVVHAVRLQARARRLRHPGAACRRQGRVHQHRAGAALSRRRTAGGDLSDRAVARPRRARRRHRSDRDQAAQFHPSRAPCRTRLQTGITYDSGEFAHVMDECLKLADWNGFAKRAAKSKKNGKLRGRGIGYFLEEAAVFNDRMELRFDPSGTVTIVAGTHSHGQGHATVYAQMVSEWLGVPFENIRFVQGDTNEVPIGRGTYGSRSMHVGGNALKTAADAIIEKAKPMAAHDAGSRRRRLEFKDGRFHIVGTDRAMALTDVAKAFYRPMFLPPQFEVGLEAAGTFAAEPPNYPNGCHVCEVEIDPETGVVDVVRYAAVDDVGKRDEHAAVRGPDPRRRRARRRPGADGGDRLRPRRPARDRQLPGLRHAARRRISPTSMSEMTEVPSTTNPLGVKGAGEAGATGAPPAVIGAMLDALRPLGIEHIDMPATPNRMWQAIQGARAGKLAAE